ncbi:MAG TPA: biotin--[acetyl-CoA-carboxylase] ligase [Porticoccaceae bacterium]|nr:biotin--[acetyl-CoA-carboxylase] ligase [Porticoccaceae bacterium]
MIVSTLALGILRSLECYAKRDSLSVRDLSRMLDNNSGLVHQALMELKQLGVPLIISRDSHYCLPPHFGLLNKGKIGSGLINARAAKIYKLVLLNTVDSTNRYARDQVKAGNVSGLVVLAEQQTAGVGRRGNRWLSPFGANIYMSIVWNFTQSEDVLQGLSLAIGVAVCRSLTKIGMSGVKLKWPNDIYVGSKKLGGILLELVGDPSGDCSVVIGVGINHDMPFSAGEAIDQAWTDIVKETVTPVSRNHLAACLIDNIFDILETFHRLGFSAYQDEWIAADLMYNMPATISNSRESISGTVLGVDEHGALRMKLENGAEKRFIGGELSLRRQV